MKPLIEMTICSMKSEKKLTLYYTTPHIISIYYSLPVIPHHVFLSKLHEKHTYADRLQDEECTLTITFQFFED